jgi:hypothetical protein
MYIVFFSRKQNFSIGVKRNVSRDKYFLKAYNIKKVLSEHVLKLLTNFEHPSSDPLQRPQSGDFDTGNATGSRL